MGLDCSWSKVVEIFLHHSCVLLYLLVSFLLMIRHWCHHQAWLLRHLVLFDMPAITECDNEEKIHPRVVDQVLKSEA